MRIVQRVGYEISGPGYESSGYETSMGTKRLYALRFSYQGNRACEDRKGMMGTIAQFFHFLADDIIIQKKT